MQSDADAQTGVFMVKGMLCYGQYRDANCINYLFHWSHPILSVLLERFFSKI